MSTQSEQTKANIQQALLTLLQEKRYDDITMAELAQQANTSRMTIHRHFGDKDNLLLACFEELAESIKNDIIFPHEMLDKRTPQLAYENILVFYTHVANNQPLYRALFTTMTGSHLRKQARRYMTGAVLRVMMEEGTLDIMSAPANVVANLLADMIVGAIIWWLDSDEHIEPAILAEIVLRLAETGFFGFTGQTPTEGDISFRPFTMTTHPPS
ncbi:MAG TPA: TetR/AcrR family transcriptional regulator [Anaerolineae bacterium]|nr:TetR/AcrR family transcriptional regulator [Anaerolineae bacterium]